MTLLTPRASRFKADKIVFFICLGVSIILIVSGLIIEPPGQIDGSVIIAVGELFSFASLAVWAQSVADGKKATIHHKDTEVSISYDKKNNEADA